MSGVWNEMANKTQFVGAKVEGGEELLRELKALGGNVRSSARAAVRAGTRVMQAQAEMNAASIGERRGKHSRIQMTSRVKGTIEGVLGPSKKFWYFRYFETGATRHEISAAPGGALVFEGDRGRVVIAQVNHPGMAARPWLRPAFDATKGEATEAVGASLKEAIEKRKAIVDREGDEE